MNTFIRLFTQFMSFETIGSSLFVIACGLACLPCAPTMAIAQMAIQRDQRALAILSKTIDAGGGQELLASILDFTEIGTITYDLPDQITGDVVVKGRGLHQLRMDADLAGGRQTTVVNGEGGSLKAANGRSWPIYRQSAADLGSLTIPYLPLIEAIKDPSIGVIYEGLMTRNGGSAYSIRLQRVYRTQQDLSGARGMSEARIFFIDSTTLLVSAISDQIHLGGNLIDQGVTHEITYSNYKTENGITTPLMVVETVHGVTGFTINIIQIKFNVGLVDSDFDW